MKSFGLVGKKLGHSFSKKYFDEHFDGRYSYSLFELEDISGLTELISRDENLVGLNITIPFKQEVLSYLDEVSPLAKEIGAVNVVSIQRVPRLRLVGDNTDAPAFEETLRRNNLLRRKALILGTGGVAKAVEYSLGRLNIHYLSVSRKLSMNALSYEHLDDRIIQQYDVIINTTPLGSFPDVDSCPNIPYNHLTDRHILYDLTYNPSETLFMKKGKEKGARAINGLEMLELQAQLSWKIWGI